MIRTECSDFAHTCGRTVASLADFFPIQKYQAHDELSQLVLGNLPVCRAAESQEARMEAGDWELKAGD